MGRRITRKRRVGANPTHNEMGAGDMKESQHVFQTLATIQRLTGAHTMYTVQLLEKQHNGYEDWQTYAVRDQHNHCVCIVGTVDHATAATSFDTAHLIADALTEAAR